jgi:hypothetical protein
MQRDAVCSYSWRLRQRWAVGAGAVLGSIALFAWTTAAQAPQPFPRPGESRSQAPPAAQKPPERPQPAPSKPPPALKQSADPTEAELGVPIYPGAQFIASYDAGRGQRYYLFGTTADFTQIVTYYRNVLKQRGELVYEEPPIHMFDVGRYREETMAFPPGVTVKDYTWAGSAGYLNPKRGAEPVRFKTVVQIVPVPAGAGGAR